ncbi:MAG: beta-ketoacyl-[acyl-carrier-protein] synthase family protein [Bdellovibrionales bacterium]|nr:beta-ketoacyl-[acyl-carrier-protein] synthase family protein [Bdellovibrionales bacterium]
MQIAITGMGLVTPAGSGIAPLWKKCLERESFIQEGLGEITNQALESLWSDIASSKWVKHSPLYLSKSLILSLHSIIYAIEEAKWEFFTNKDIIIIGTTTGQIGRWEKDIMNLLKIDSDVQSDKNKMRAQPLQTLTENLKHVLDFPGNILVLASACSASTQAISSGYDFLASHRADRCIVGGVEELSALTITGFSCLKLLSTSPCKPFDESRVGINLSEGAGFYTLERGPIKKEAQAYIYGGETVLDSYHMTAPSVEGTGLQKSIWGALKKSNLRPEDITMVHAHGTGSIHNDQSEAFALSSVLSHNPPVISTKGVHGHALGASGAVEMGICLQILKTGIIPPVTGLETVDERIKVNVSNTAIKKEVKYLLKTTLGFGGVNTSFILGAHHA